MRSFQKITLFFILSIVFISSVVFSEEPRPTVDLNTLFSKQVFLKGGDRTYGESGLDLHTGTVTGFTTTETDLAVQDNRDNETLPHRYTFFLPFSKEPFNDPDNARGGITYATIDKVKHTFSCPQDSNRYYIHWYEPRLGQSYCLKTRHGEAYGIIRVDEIADEGIKISIIATNGIPDLFLFESTPQINLR